MTQLTDSTVEMTGRIIWVMSVCFPILKGQNIFDVEKAKSLRRDPEKGVFYAHFKSHQHHRLDVSPIKITSFWNRQECAQDCTHTISCFSFNLASKIDLHGKLICELLPSDLYAELDKFGVDPNFNHFSIKVNVSCFFCCIGLLFVYPVTFLQLFGRCKIHGIYIFLASPLHPPTTARTLGRIIYQLVLLYYLLYFPSRRRI